MKLAKRRSAVIKDLEYVKEMRSYEFQLGEDYVKSVIKDALSFIKMQDDQIRTIRGQRDKARREIKAAHEKVVKVLNNEMRCMDELKEVYGELPDYQKGYGQACYAILLAVTNPYWKPDRPGDMTKALKGGDKE